MQGLCSILLYLQNGSHNLLALFSFFILYVLNVSVFVCYFDI